MILAKRKAVSNAVCTTSGTTASAWIAGMSKIRVRLSTTLWITWRIANMLPPYTTVDDTGWMHHLERGVIQPGYHMRTISFDRALTDEEVDRLRELFLASDLAIECGYNYLGFRRWADTMYEFCLKKVIFSGFRGGRHG
jgi:hypothetical protein